MVSEMYDMLYRPEDDERRAIPHDIELASAAFDEAKLRNVAAALLNAGLSIEKIPDILIQDYGFSPELLQKTEFYPKGFKDDTDYFTREKNNAGKSIDFLLRNNISGESLPTEVPIMGETTEALYGLYEAGNPFEPESSLNFMPNMDKKASDVQDKVSDQEAGNVFLQENREGYMWNLLQNVGDPGSSVLNAIDMILNRTYDGE